MLKAEIIGTIGADAEVREFSGKKYVSLSVACNDYAKDQQGNRTETTTWVSVLWYGDGGGLLPYLKKGAKVFIRGNLKAKAYTDKQGAAQASININAFEVELCGFKSDGNSNTTTQATTTKASSQNNDLPF